MKDGMTVEYLKSGADLNLVDGAMGTIATKRDLILFGK